MFKWLKNIFKSPTVKSAECIYFHKELAHDSDVAILTVTISTTQEVVELLERTLKTQTYQILSEHTNEYQLPKLKAIN